MVSRDAKTVITCGRDKKIKVWDWIKIKLLASLTGHDDCVESIVLSSDEKLLYSASLDMKVILWSMYTYNQIFTLNADFPLRTI